MSFSTVTHQSQRAAIAPKYHSDTPPISKENNLVSRLNTTSPNFNITLPDPAAVTTPRASQEYLQLGLIHSYQPQNLAAKGRKAATEAAVASSPCRYETSIAPTQKIERQSFLEEMNKILHDMERKMQESVEVRLLRERNRELEERVERLVLRLSIITTRARKFQQKQGPGDAAPVLEQKGAMQTDYDDDKEEEQEEWEWELVDSRGSDDTQI